MFYLILFAYLISLSLSVGGALFVTDRELSVALQATNSPSNTDWTEVVTRMRAGISDGIEEAQHHAETSRELEDTGREEAGIRFRGNWITRLRASTWREGIDVYSTVYAVASAAAGISFQLRNEILAKNGIGLSFSSTTGVEKSMSSLFAISYIFSIESLVMALTAPLDRSNFPPRLRNVPKFALLGGVFAAISCFSLIISSPSLGVSIAGLANVMSGVVSGLIIDNTGFYGLVPQRRVNRAQIFGVLTMGVGLLANMDLSSFVGESTGVLSALPFLGLTLLGGAASPVSVCLGSVVAEYGGNKLVAGAISYFVGMLTLMMTTLVMYVSCGQPPVHIEGSHFWEWIGGLVSLYGVWASMVLPKRIGLGTYVAVETAAFTVSSQISDGLNLFGDNKKVTPLRVMGAAMCILGIFVIQWFPGVVPASQDAISEVQVNVLGDPLQGSEIAISEESGNDRIEGKGEPGGDNVAEPTLVSGTELEEILFTLSEAMNV